MRLPKTSQVIDKKGKITSLHVATFNVRTLSDDVHLQSLEIELSRIKWDIVGISEMRRPGEKILELNSKHILYNKGNNKKQGGVGFLINKRLSSNIEKFNATSDRVISVTLNISKRYNLKVIQVYAPTSLSCEEELEQFYEDLYSEFNNNKAHFNIIMGDFNAKIGRGEEECLGPFSYGNRNDRGDDLINFATANNFKIMNTFFKKKINRRWTWRSPNFETFNEIDYILSDQLCNVKDVQILNRVDIGSDHRMVRARITIDTKRERRKLFYSKPKPIRIAEESVNDFQVELRHRYDTLKENSIVNNYNQVNDINNNITIPLVQAAENWKETTKPTAKFTTSTLELMKKRRNLQTPATDREKIEAAELNKTIRKAQREDLRKRRTKIVEQFISQGRGFKTAKRKLNNAKSQFTEILEEDGSITTNRNRIVERAREFYEKLYSSDKMNSTKPEGQQQFHDFPKIESWEIQLAIKQSKKGKAPGPDNINIDLIEAAGEIICEKIAHLFNECLKQSKVPDDWNEAIIILLHKKGDARDIANFRPISLLNNIYKLFTKVITNRIGKTLDENQPREQAGFRKGFSTMDHLHTTNQLIEKCTEYKIPLVASLIDYSKAFDSVEIPEVIEALKEQGIEEVYISVIEHIYSYAQSYIRMHEDSRFFKHRRGVRQGDTSSPKLFTACLERALKKLKWENKGINIDGEHLSHLRFADDIIIFANNMQDLQQMINEINTVSQEVGLSINLKKTKIMKNKYVTDDNQAITINNIEIEKVDHYVYLGQLISMESASKEQEIKRRITMGWQAFGRASEIFKNKNMPLILKRKAYDQCILPTVTYGAETWNLTKALTLKLRTMQRAHERIMLGITWQDRKTAKWIREQTKVRDIVEVINNLKWNWAGHISRRNDNRWTTRITNWTPRGHTRNRGRQKTRWRDDLDKFQNHWHRTAQDRTSWRNMGKAYTQQRVQNG